MEQAMTEPKLIEVPGIPGKLREQTLDEFLAVLTPDHLARQQLNEIRNQALKSVELSTQLMQANEKVLELQSSLMLQRSASIAVQPEPTPRPLTTQEVYAVHKVIAEITEPPPVPALTTETNPRYGPFPKAECPSCKQMVSTSPVGWAAHQRKAHPDHKAPRPV